jgi:phosphoribosylformimino-5-aminoimidazole carboxamide ribotide isomerase
MSDWAIYPAIDLRQGRVVRLRQGDPAQETIYGDDPLAVAGRWQAAGAGWVHVVNLDGAFGEEGGENLAALGRIVGTGLRVQFGGGLRDLESVRRVLEMGVRRAILGTAAVEEPSLVGAALAAFGPERIAVAIDARQGLVRTHGWRQDSALTAGELARWCGEAGVRWIIHTDVARDGMGRGLNVEASRQLVRNTGLAGDSSQGLRVIASGGVASLEDVQRAHSAGLSGVVIGRALYDGALCLEDALGVGRRRYAG